jgi:hypothetical protein
VAKADFAPECRVLVKAIDVGLDLSETNNVKVALEEKVSWRLLK